jgi:hypothetical protein
LSFIILGWAADLGFASGILGIFCGAFWVVYGIWKRIKGK